MKNGENVRARLLNHGKGPRVWDLQWNVDGKKFTKRGFPTKKAAQAFRRKVLTDADRGAFVAPSGRAFGVYLRAWLDTRPANGTTATYRRHVEAHILSPRLRPSLENIPLQKLRAEDLERLYRFLLEEDGLSVNTVRFAHVVVKMALRTAEEREYVTRNVAAKVRTLPAPTRPEFEPYTLEEARRFLEAAYDDRLYAAWRLYFTVGPRRNEVLQLLWGDVNLDTAEIVICRGGDNGSTKSGKARTWSLDAETVAALRSHHRAQAEERFALGLGKAEKDDHVFTRPDGRPLTEKLIRNAQLDVEARAEVPHRRIHDMRHAAATFALAAGVDVKRVQVMLGHSTAAFTLDKYA
ncbi:MAG: tyrosine-type recombinase/integrase, partial [Actinomycetota bacterium]